MDTVTLKFKQLFKQGWIIVSCSCNCGGKYAWMKPRESGAYEMVGCVCHYTFETLKQESRVMIEEIVNRLITDYILNDDQSRDLKIFAETMNTGLPESELVSILESVVNHFIKGF